MTDVRRVLRKTGRTQGVDKAHWLALEHALARLPLKHSDCPVKVGNEVLADWRDADAGVLRVVTPEVRKAVSGVLAGACLRAEGEMLTPEVAKLLAGTDVLLGWATQAMLMGVKCEE